MELGMKLYLLLGLSFLLIAHLSAEDWPTYGGKNRDHRSSEKSLRTDWQGEEPEVLWEKEVGLGYSSVIEVGGMAYTQGYKDGENTLFCVDAQTGKISWTHSYPSELGDKYFQGGSRSTPTIFQGVIYLQGHDGHLFALEARTGRQIWKRHLVEDFAGERPTWGFSGAPLAVNEKLILQLGAPEGSLLALDRRNGREIWRWGNAGAGYASPYIRNSFPNEIVVFNQRGLSIHNLKDGKEVFHYPHLTRYEVNAAQPLDLGKQILVASAYGKGAALVDFQGREPKAVWESDGISCQMASLVQRNGYAFGIHGQTGTRASQATLFCLDLQNGKKRWEERGYGVGTLILVDDILVVLSDRGELALLQADSEQFLELARFHILSGKNNWTPPTYANGRMHCRSSSGRWICLAMSRDP
jgi:outer membrane protein assembly factor BamB